MSALLSPPLASTRELIDELAAGRMIVLMDEEDRENEGDLVIAADKISPEAINFMTHYGRGLICLTLTAERCQQLGLQPMTRDNRSSMTTAFTVSIEAARGVTTGISAQDRAQTILAAVAAAAVPADLVQPGHVFPIVARPGGVLVRAGHTEAGCDLAGLAGLTPAAVICEILRDDGHMARLPDLLPFAQRHGLKIGTIVDLIQYRAASETLVCRQRVSEVHTPYGAFQLHAFSDTLNNGLHLALVRGQIAPTVETLVRVHQSLSLWDLLCADLAVGSFTLADALRAIDAMDHGVVLCLHVDESKDDFLTRFDTLGSHPPTTPQRRWDPRSHGIGAQILHALGVGKVRLLGSPMRIPSMTGFDLELSGFVSDKAALTEYVQHSLHP